jgi:hypothetical protein
LEGGHGAVVAVVNGVGSHDVAVTGCMGVVGCDAAGSVDGWGRGTVQQGVVLDVLVVPVDIPASLSGRGGSSWSAICVTALTVQVGFSLLVCTAILQVLGASVDIPTSFSRCGVSSVGTVWIMALAVQVGMVWVLESIVMLVVGFVCTPSSTWASSFFIPSRSAVLPRSSPSVSPFSYPSLLASINGFVSSCSSSA